MRRAILALAVIALLLALAPTGQAALNKPKPFTADFAYMQGLGTAGGAITLVSGEVEATTKDATGSYGFFETNAVTVGGLRQVCTSAAPTLKSCTTASNANPYILAVKTGGSFAVCFPVATGGEFASDHSLGMFVDFGATENLNNFGLDKSLVAPSVNGQFDFAAVPAISSPMTPATINPCQSQGGLTAIDDTTQVEVREGTNVLATLTGKSASFAFTGTAVISDIEAAFVVLPFSPSSTSHFTRASDDAAKDGLDFANINDLIHKVDDADAGMTTDRKDIKIPDAAKDVISGLLNGAVLSHPDQDKLKDQLDEARIVRFSHLDVDGASGGKLDWSGKAYLDFEDGKISGAKPLVGFAMFQLPWWSYALWVVALVVFIVRIVLRAPKKNAVWDKFGWIGWVASPLAWILVAYLWDNEVRNVLGVSALHGSDGKFRLIVAGLELALLLIVAFAAITPLRLLLKNGFMLARQGKFMGIAGALAVLIGFLLGAVYLRSYLGPILEQVMAALSKT